MDEIIMYIVASLMVGCSSYLRKPLQEVIGKTRMNFGVFIFPYTSWFRMLKEQTFGQMAQQTH